MCYKNNGKGNSFIRPLIFYSKYKNLLINNEIYDAEITRNFTKKMQLV